MPTRKEIIQELQEKSLCCLGKLRKPELEVLLKTLKSNKKVSARFYARKKAGESCKSGDECYSKQCYKNTCVTKKDMDKLNRPKRVKKAEPIINKPVKQSCDCNCPKIIAEHKLEKARAKAQSELKQIMPKVPKVPEVPKALKALKAPKAPRDKPIPKPVVETPKRTSTPKQHIKPPSLHKSKTPAKARVLSTSSPENSFKSATSTKQTCNSELCEYFNV